MCHRAESFALNHNMVTGIHYLIGSLLGDIVSSLEEITKAHILGIHLGIETHKLEKIEENHPRDVDRQMTEVIKHWQRNNTDCSWEALANAVEKMGEHENLVKRLRDRHLDTLNSATKQVKHGVL